jgi:hypothetical protein
MWLCNGKRAILDAYLVFIDIQINTLHVFIIQRKGRTMFHENV